MAKLIMRSGAEGPQHDPYHYMERTFIATKGWKMTLHSGLTEWLEMRSAGIVVKWTDKDCVKKFEETTGLTIKQFDKYYHRIEYPTKCPKCGSRKLRDVNGYPGEELTICDDCRSIVASHFNESAII